MYSYYKPKREMGGPNGENEENEKEAEHFAEKDRRTDPFAPVLPELEVVGMLLEALKDEATDIQYMGKLMQMTKCQEDKEIVRQIRMDEQKHYKMFSDMLIQLTGKRPHVEPEDLPVNKNILFDYERNIFASLKAADFYRKIYFAYRNVETRDMLYEIITDEQSHGTQFGYLYAKNRI